MLLAQVPAELFSPSLDAKSLFFKMGQWNVANGRWRRAADRYVVLVNVNQVDKSDRTEAATTDLLMAAPLLIECGDVVTYDSMRRKALARMGDTQNPIAAEHLVKISSLMSTDAALNAKLEPLAQVISQSLTNPNPKVNGGPFNSAWRAMALGMFEYRRGNFTKAGEWFQKSLDYKDPLRSHIIITEVFQGATFLKLGEMEKGNDILRQADVEITSYFNKYQGTPPLNDSRNGILQDWLIARQVLRGVNSTTNAAPAD